ncbi:M43 family zinc metalloprotease [Shewanella violacea]|nr:M43 family zinc metalloprotease [Shewanella violacea]
MLKKQLITVIGLTGMTICMSSVYATPQAPVGCGTESAMERLYKLNPSSLQEAKSLEQMTLGNNHAIRSTAASSPSAQLVTSPTYVIPTVFHVYGTSFNGKSVDDSIIIDALLKTNEDFQGLTSDFNEIIPEFSGVKDTLNIEFRLAKIDPYGNATSGIVYHANACGAGNYSDTNVANDNWDNYKYMNVYIQNDLYCDGTTNNSGVAWYPDTSMSNAGIARVAYNGAYLGLNTSENFRSVLTHEFGHYLNLIHTFEGSCRKPNENKCSSTGDQVCDTPQVDHSSLGSAANCMGQVTNWQNFMNYSSQYANFTYNQVSRSTNAINSAARNTLWTQANLVATGTDNSGGGTNQSPISVVNGPYSGLANSSITFNSGGSYDPDGNINSYSWNFGDGKQSNLANPSHSYTAPGNYTVTLTVTDNQGSSASSSTSADITGGSTGGNELLNASPRYGLSANTGQYLHYFIDLPAGASNLQVNISGGSGDADLYTRFNAEPTDSSYNCRPYASGNNESCSEPSPSAGRWYVSIKSYSAFADLTLEASFTSGGANSAPVPVINGPYNGTTGNGVNFSSAGSNDPDGNITAYQWSFGDGTSSSQASPSHTYSAQGTYSVSLSVTDDAGATASSTTTATISGGSVPGGITDACATQSPIDYISLDSGVPVCVTSGTGGVLYFYFYNEAATSAKITTEHGSGDATLYYRASNWPTASQYDALSANPDNSESISINNLAVGWNYIMINGSHSGMSIQVDTQ